MFIRFFKTSQPASFIALPLLAVMLWLPGLMHSEATPVYSPIPFYDLFSGINSFPFVSRLLAFLLVLLQGFYLNHLINKYDLREGRERNNFLNALFFIFFLSLFPAFRTLLPQHFSGFFLLLMLDRIFASYRKDQTFSNCFDAGLFSGIASLFYFPCVVFFFMAWTGWVVLRAFSWREWLISFIGFMTPWLFVSVGYFWRDNLGYLFTEEIAQLFSSDYFSFGKPQHAILILVFLPLFFLPAVPNFLKALSSGKVRSNKFFLLFAWFLFYAIVSGFVFPVNSYTHFSLAAAPLAVIFSLWFFSLKKSWIAESLFAILLGAFIYAEVMCALG